MNKVYIIAGNYAQARLCASQNDLCSDDFIYVTDCDRVRELNLSSEVWYTGTYFMNKNTAKITEELKTRRIPIIIKPL